VPRIPTLSRAAIAAVISAVLLGATALPASASSHRTRALISTAGCDAFADYFTIEFLVGFASAFAGLGDELGGTKSKGGDVVTKEDVQDVFHLVFSPKLERVTGTLAREVPRSIRGLFARQRDVFAKGVDKLEQLGLTKKQIAALAVLDLKPDTDVKAVIGDVDLPTAKITSAARDFGKDADELGLDSQVSKSQQRDFERTASTCGVFPARDVDCESLVSSDTTNGLVGGAATVTNDNGSCTYEGPKDPGGDEPVMVVDVYRTPRTFARLVEQLQGGEPLDPDTYVARGFSTFSSTKTCGKTLVSRTDDSTVVVALCSPGGGEIADASLVGVRGDRVAGGAILTHQCG
jgi:hypothetical protein